MQEQYIEVKCETIGVLDQRNLIEMARTLGRVMTKEEYVGVALAFQKTIDRLVNEAEKQGIEI